MMSYILVIFLSTEFIACTREENHCYLKLKTSGQELVGRIKFGVVFGIIFFLYYFFQPTTGLKTRYNTALVFRLDPAQANLW